jgi:cation:H+ antiporter
LPTESQQIELAKAMLTILLLVGGLTALVVGAELLVRGAASMAEYLHISPLVVGLTIVAYGTSTPELAVSVFATLQGNAAISLGNVIGSNICNVLLILGASAVITPLIVHAKLVYFDVPLMVVLSLVLVLVARDGEIQRIEGFLFCLGLLCYTGWLIFESRREHVLLAEPGPAHDGTAGRDPATGVSAEPAMRRSSWLAMLGQAGLFVGGLALLVGGSQFFVQGAKDVARLFGLSDLVVGLTVVAAGTSLPELATSLLAAVRGQRDIAVGNVVGSNIFNILGVLGVSAAVSTDGLFVGSAARNFDLPVMLAVAVACVPIFFSGHRINRWEGVLFLGYYVAYVAYLVMASSRHEALPLFSNVMWWFVIPLTAVTLTVVTVRTIREGNPKGDPGRVDDCHRRSVSES